jgi:hypothetical protein
LKISLHRMILLKHFYNYWRNSLINSFYKFKPHKREGLNAENARWLLKNLRHNCYYHCPAHMVIFKIVLERTSWKNLWLIWISLTARNVMKIQMLTLGWNFNKQMRSYLSRLIDSKVMGSLPKSGMSSLRCLSSLCWTTSSMNSSFLSNIFHRVPKKAIMSLMLTKLEYGMSTTTMR